MMLKEVCHSSHQVYAGLTPSQGPTENVIFIAYLPKQEARGRLTSPR